MPCNSKTIGCRSKPIKVLDSGKRYGVLIYGVAFTLYFSSSFWRSSSALPWEQLCKIYKCYCCRWAKLQDPLTTCLPFLDKLMCYTLCVICVPSLTTVRQLRDKLALYLLFKTVIHFFHFCDSFSLLTFFREFWLHVYIVTQYHQMKMTNF